MKHLLLLVLAVLLTGCGNSPHPGGEADEDVLYRGLAFDPKTLDPSVNYENDPALITDLIYPSYFQYDYLRRDPYATRLCLGAKAPVYQCHPDGHETWTFTLRKDLRFADDPCFPGGIGRTVTARDLVYSFQRMADPAVGCPAGSFVADKIIGWQECVAGFKVRGKANYKDEYLPKGIRLEPGDPYTFHLDLARPYPQLPYLMTLRFTTPQAHEAVDRYGADYAWHPVGCGLYRLRRFVPKHRYELVARTDGPALFHAGKPLPRNRKIVYLVIPEASTQWHLLQQGYLDICDLFYLPPILENGNQLPAAARANGLRFERGTPGVTTNYLVFNMNDVTWGGDSPSHRKLRQAIVLALDRKTLRDLFKPANGTEAQELQPPALFGHDPSYRGPYSSPDLARAKRLLDEAGYPADTRGKRSLVLRYSASPTNAVDKNHDAWIVQQLERLGLKVEYPHPTPEALYDEVKQGRHQLTFYSWTADYPDPENFAQLLYGPNAISRSNSSGINSSNYQSKRYDALFEAMRSLTNTSERKKLLAQMRELVAEDCPIIPLVHIELVHFYQPWVGNYKLHPMALDAYQYVSVDASARHIWQQRHNRPRFDLLAALTALLLLATLPLVRVVHQERYRRLRPRGIKGNEGNP